MLQTKGPSTAGEQSLKPAGKVFRTHLHAQPFTGHETCGTCLGLPQGVSFSPSSRPPLIPTESALILSSLTRPALWYEGELAL